ncbi:efflux transporter outer membrane subunit [Aureliella helgolandensis]|uniref:Cation efflux system protein CusC n=1 Tax=Aureliella helgolandensis TaxID=2527968 RepID=A0A518FZN8_9BACT|nr:efflux transporter outer membrane subunit [Aureliella helgolandensis]QDV21828.1 Cation efflux system protein CusC precursor [Aureliella helgolandensis]
MKFSVKNQSVERRNARLRKAFALSILLTLPACSIPTLRCAQPGPVLPQSYNLSTYWNNHPTSWGFGSTSGAQPSASTAQQGSAAETTAANSEIPASPFQLTSAVKPASSLDLQDPSAPNAAPSGGIQGATGYDLGPTDLSPTNLDAPPNLDGSVNTFENSSQIAWCDFFNDPILTGLINQALVGNQELRILAEEIQIASNEVQSRQGEYLPFVTLGAGAGVEKPSLFTRNGAVEDQLEVLPGKAFPDPLPDFLIATNVSWEIDIWKKLRNARNAAALRYLGTREGRNYVVTRMVAEVAENYYELLALDNQLITLDKTIDIQQRSLETANAMKEAARGTELSVQRFQAEVRKNQSEKLIIQQKIVEAENRINFLLGRYPQPVDRISVEYVDLNLHALSVGVPSQLLQNRADIREAERELAAAGLEVKVARARFYPSLNLSAGVGYRAFNPNYLLTSPESLIYNAAGDLIAPLINKKAIRADYMSANARQLQSVYNYQRSILNAFTEVTNYVTKVENYRQSIEIKKQQLDSLEASVDSATQLFQNARAEYVEVLLAQRDMMEAKMVLIETKQQQLSATVKAYQALGGGGVPTRVN